jgi:hypothetical protein
MAKRFYLPSGGSAPVSPAYSALWASTNNAAALPLNTTKGSSASTDVLITSGTGWVNSSSGSLSRQFVSAPLSAQTISGTIKGQIRTRNSDQAGGCRNAIVIRVVSNDGLTERAVLYSQFVSATGLTGANPDWFRGTTGLSGVNRSFPVGTPPVSGALTSYTCVSGDRLVIEIGHTRETASKNARITYGESDGVDLPEDITTNLGDPWIEFSATIAMQGGGSSSNGRYYRQLLGAE